MAWASRGSLLGPRGPEGPAGGSGDPQLIVTDGTPTLQQLSDALVAAGIIDVQPPSASAPQARTGWSNVSSNMGTVDLGTAQAGDTVLFIGHSSAAIDLNSSTSFVEEFRSPNRPSLRVFSGTVPASGSVSLSATRADGGGVAGTATVFQGSVGIDSYTTNEGYYQDSNKTDPDMQVPSLTVPSPSLAISAFTFVAVNSDWDGVLGDLVDWTTVSDGGFFDGTSHYPLKVFSREFPDGGATGTLAIDPPATDVPGIFIGWNAHVFALVNT